MRALAAVSTVAALSRLHRIRCGHVAGSGGNGHRNPLLQGLGTVSPASGCRPRGSPGGHAGGRYANAAFLCAQQCGQPGPGRRATGACWSKAMGFSTPLELSYPDIRGMPGRTLVSYLECAGNHRAMFDLVQGRPAKRHPVDDGSRGQRRVDRCRPARCTDTRAGIREDAASVLLIGLDVDAPEEGFPARPAGCEGHAPRHTCWPMP